MSADGREADCETRASTGARCRPRNLPYFLAVLALVVGLAAWQAAVAPRTVERVATKVGRIPAYRNIRYLTVSDHQLVVLGSGPAASTATPVLLDIATGRSEPMPHLRGWIHDPRTIGRSELQLSPTGEWFLRVLRDARGGHTVLIHRGGRPTIVFPVRSAEAYAAAWTTDGSEWVEFAGPAPESRSASPTTSYWHRTATPGAAAAEHAVDLPPHVIPRPYALVPLSNGRVAGTDFDTYPEPVTAFAVDADNRAAGREVHQLDLSRGPSVEAVLVSPDGQHLAWLRSRDARRSSVMRFIYRWFPSWEPEPAPGASVYVSHLDGSGMREVLSEPTLINDIGWCGDGKHLWLTCRGSLWTVTTE